MAGVLRLIGNEYEAANDVYDYDGNKVLCIGDAFILTSVDDSGIAGFVKTTSWPGSVRTFTDYGALTGSEPTGRIVFPHDDRLGLGRPGKKPLPHLTFASHG